MRGHEGSLRFLIMSGGLSPAGPSGSHRTVWEAVLPVKSLHLAAAMRQFSEIAAMSAARTASAPRPARPALGA
jgi:hypothetical protein